MDRLRSTTSRDSTALLGVVIDLVRALDALFKEQLNVVDKRDALLLRKLQNSQVSHMLSQNRFKCISLQVNV